jgi:cell division protein FtsQ
LVGVTWYYLKRPGSFPIKTIHIDGQVQYISKTDIEKIIYPYIDKGFFNIKIKDLKSRLLNIAGVRFVNVTRTWPNALLITIKDEKAVATWGVNGLVSSYGREFNPTDRKKFNDLPQFICEKRDIAKVLKVYKEALFITSKNKEFQFKITSLKYKENNWVISFAHGDVVTLGRKDIFDRLKLFLKYQPMLVYNKDKKQSLYVDMRYPNGFAVSNVRSG